MKTKMISILLAGAALMGLAGCGADFLDNDIAQTVESSVTLPEQYSITYEVETAVGEVRTVRKIRDGEGNVYFRSGDEEQLFIKDGDLYALYEKDSTGEYVARGIQAAYNETYVDSVSAEFITFNEMHSSMYDMRLGMKDYALYDLENDKYYASNGDLKGGDRDTTEMEIVHEDWAFMRELDGFIPTWYNIKLKVEDGVYEVRAHVCNARTWGVTFQVPDNPVATLIFDTVEGKFVNKDGSVRTLTGGRGSMSIRQWHQYPNILPRELYSDEKLTGEKFETL